jgi:hypothetical protein
MRTKKRSTSRRPRDQIAVKGFFRLNILENGKVVGDSGWQKNVIVNNGYLMYLSDLLGKSTTSKQISRAMLGSGGDPAVGDNTLSGEFNTATYTRTTVTYAAVSSKTARFTMTWASANAHITASTTLGNIGLINDTTSGGTMMAGKSFATSQWNQEGFLLAA